MFRHIVRGLIDAYGRTQFEFRRQRDPQLEAARPACFVEAAAVPHAASSLHPFDAAGRQGALDVVRVDIGDYAFRDIVRVAIPECGWRPPLEGAPSWSKRSRNTNGFRISPKSDGLIKRVARPCVRPRVRCAIARALLGGGDTPKASAARATRISPSACCMPQSPVGARATGMATSSPIIVDRIDRFSMFTATRCRKQIAASSRSLARYVLSVQEPEST